MTVAERARKRASQSRIRAVYHAPNQDRVTGIFTEGWYRVYNLTRHVAYTVVRVNDAWHCTCPAISNRQRCKHVQRVLDREERRIKQEAIANE